MGTNKSRALAPAYARSALVIDCVAHGALTSGRTNFFRHICHDWTEAPVSLKTILRIAPRCFWREPLRETTPAPRIRDHAKSLSCHSHARSRRFTREGHAMHKRRFLLSCKERTQIWL